MLNLWLNAIRSSEFYGGLGAVIAGYLVQQGLLSAAAVPWIQQAVVYCALRIISKVAKHAIPSPQPPAAAAVGPAGSAGKKIGTVVGLIALGLSLLGILLAANPARAASLLDPDRLSGYVGASFEAKTAQGQAVEKDGAANLFLNADLTKSFAGVVRTSFGVQDKELRVSPGIKYRVKVGSESFASELSYDFYAGAEVPEYANEWAVSLMYSRPIAKYLLLSVVETLGLDNHQARTSVQGSVPFLTAKAKP
jgi:hypothetical protein